MNLNFLHWQVVGMLKHPLAPCLPPSHLVKFSLSNCLLDYMVDFVFLNYNSPNCSSISLLTNISLLILTISFSVCSVQIILGCNVIHFTCNYAKYLIHRDLRWTLSDVYFTVLRFFSLLHCILLTLRTSPREICSVPLSFSRENRYIPFTNVNTLAMEKKPSAIYCGSYEVQKYLSEKILVQSS